MLTSDIQTYCTRNKEINNEYRHGVYKLHTCMHEYILMLTYVRTYTEYVYTHIHVYILIYTYVYIHVHTHTPTKDVCLKVLLGCEGLCWLWSS